MSDIPSVRPLIAQGVPYAEVVSNVVPLLKQASNELFVYWKPEKGTYAIRLKDPCSAKRAEIEKDAALCFFKAGCVMNADFDNKACERTGCILLHHPKEYQPFKQLRKFASLTDTPGKFALTGALLGGLGLFGYKMLMPSEGADTLGKRVRSALHAGALGTSVGMLPGLAGGYSNWVNAKGDKSLWSTMGSTHEDMRRTSKNYEIQDDNRIDHLERHYSITPEEAARQKSVKYKSAAFGDIAGPLDLSRSNVVGVDNFNRITWNAAKDGTLDFNNAMMTSGILDTTSARTNSSFVSPASIAGTLVNAGIGYVTSAVIGKTLGAMGMMSQKNQEKLRELGTWGGLIQGVGNKLN